MNKIAPSILSADFARLKEEIQMVEQAGAELLHIDVMDGHFVPNITIGPCVISSIRAYSNLIFDVHLMIENPERYIEDFVKSGADIITVHEETVLDVKSVITKIKALGVKAGVSINPATEVERIKQVLDEVDMVLIMTVNPGFGGQSLIEEALSKVRYIREKYKNLDIEVDGGINTQTVQKAVRAGANVIVAGSAIYGSENPGEVIKVLREAK